MSLPVLVLPLLCAQLALPANDGAASAVLRSVGGVAAETGLVQDGSHDERDPSAEARVDDDLRRRNRPSEVLRGEELDPISRAVLEWGGLRPALEERGVRIEMLYTADGTWTPRGGAAEQDAFARGLLDLTFEFETRPLLGLPGGKLHLGFEWIHGVDASSRIGVLQPISSIDADRRAQLGRAWYEQVFEATGTRVRLGKFDANALFAFVDAAAHFQHSSMGFSPTVFLLPSYPDAAFGAAFVQELGPATLRLGALDGALARGVPTGSRGPSTLFDGRDEWFLIGEAGVAWDTGRAAVGAWTSTADVPRFDGGVESGTSGTYALLEQRLWTTNDSKKDASRVDAFAQLGWADDAVSPFATHQGAGLVWSAPFDEHAHRIGLGASRVGLSNEPGAGFGESSETAVELYYAFEPLPWMRVQPDVQYVANPGGDPALDDAWVLTLRATLSL